MALLDGVDGRGGSQGKHVHLHGGTVASGGLFSGEQSAVKEFNVIFASFFFSLAHSRRGMLVVK